MSRGSVQVLVILLIIIALGVGIYFYQNFQKKTVKPPAAVATQKISVTDEYSNKARGFKFTYPKNLSAREDSEEEYNKRGNGNFRKNFTGYVGYAPPEFLGAVAVLDETGSYDTNSISVWVFNNDNNKTLEEWFDKYWYYPFVWGVFDYTSKGHIALDQEATVSGETAKSKIVSYQSGEPKYIYVSKNSKMYLFRIIDDKDHTGDQILSSFKFIQ